MGLEICSTNKYVGVIKTLLVFTPRKAQEMNFPASFQFPAIPAQPMPELSGPGGWKMLDLCTRRKAVGVFHPYFCIVTPVCALYLRGLSPKAPTAQPWDRSAGITLLTRAADVSQQKLVFQLQPSFPDTKLLLATAGFMIFGLNSQCWPQKESVFYHVKTEALIIAYGLEFPWIFDSLRFSVLLFFILDWPFCSLYSVCLFFSSCLEMFTKKPQINSAR